LHCPIADKYSLRRFPGSILFVPIFEKLSVRPAQSGRTKGASAGAERRGKAVALDIVTRRPCDHAVPAGLEQQN
jgi:hypothetical protein